VEAAASAARAMAALLSFAPPPLVAAASAALLKRPIPSLLEEALSAANSNGDANVNRLFARLVAALCDVASAAAPIAAGGGGVGQKVFEGLAALAEGGGAAERAAILRGVAVLVGGGWETADLGTAPSRLFLAFLAVTQERDVPAEVR
jgi:hypothetical protein